MPSPLPEFPAIFLCQQIRWESSSFSLLPQFLHLRCFFFLVYFIFLSFLSLSSFYQCCIFISTFLVSQVTSVAGKKKLSSPLESSDFWWRTTSNFWCIVTCYRSFSGFTWSFHNTHINMTSNMYARIHIILILYALYTKNFHVIMYTFRTKPELFLSVIIRIPLNIRTNTCTALCLHSSIMCLYVPYFFKRKRIYFHIFLILNMYYNASGNTVSPTTHNRSL